MRMTHPALLSTVLLAGFLAGGSTTHTVVSSTPPEAPVALRAASRPDQAQGLALLPAPRARAGTFQSLTAAPENTEQSTDTSELKTASEHLGNGVFGIPEIVLAAYRNAELTLHTIKPECALPWNLLAGIGKVESGHARSGQTDTAGTTSSPIYGPALDGSRPGDAVVTTADGHPERAVGPMQFLPGTWAKYQADGNGDGISDPNNVFDASLAAGKYLCSGNTPLNTPEGQTQAVLRYNHSRAYAEEVLQWSEAYRTGTVPDKVEVSSHTEQPRSDYHPPSAAPSTPPPLVQQPAPDQQPPTPPAPADPPMIRIPGLPPIPCGVLCGPPFAPPTHPPSLSWLPTQSATPSDPTSPDNKQQSSEQSNERQAPGGIPDAVQ